jgi:hypothetical protein
MTTEPKAVYTLLASTTCNGFPLYLYAREVAGWTDVWTDEDGVECAEHWRPVLDFCLSLHPITNDGDRVEGDWLAVESWQETLAETTPVNDEAVEDLLQAYLKEHAPLYSRPHIFTRLRHAAAILEQLAK